MSLERYQDLEVTLDTLSKTGVVDMKLYDELIHEVGRLQALQQAPEMTELPFYNRGMGLDETYGCFVCGLEHPQYYYHNITTRVGARPQAERAATWFPNGGVRVDHRYWEPGYIQLKIGACDLHKQRLVELEREVSCSKLLTPEMVKHAIGMPTIDAE
jgi:hypothetical protein